MLLDQPEEMDSMAVTREAQIKELMEWHGGYWNTKATHMALQAIGAMANEAAEFAAGAGKPTSSAMVRDYGRTTREMVEKGTLKLSKVNGSYVFEI